MNQIASFSFGRIFGASFCLSCNEGYYIIPGVSKNTCLPNTTLSHCLHSTTIGCDKCEKGVRLGIKVAEDGTKTRFCKKCEEIK